MGNQEMQELPQGDTLMKKISQAEAVASKISGLLHHEQQECVDSESSSGISMDSTEDGSTSTSDFTEEASSPASSFSSSSIAKNDGNDPLSDLSELMAKLPLKRGLSNYYDGKSQSFASLANANSLEDLVKKENPQNKRIKLCRSYAGELDLQGHDGFCISHVTMANKKFNNSTRSAPRAAIGRSRSHHHPHPIRNMNIHHHHHHDLLLMPLSCSRPPLIPVQKQFF